MKKAINALIGFYISLKGRYILYLRRKSLFKLHAVYVNEGVQHHLSITVAGKRDAKSLIKEMGNAVKGVQIFFENTITKSIINMQ